jgi:hypothetical protein
MRHRKLVRRIYPLTRGDESATYSLVVTLTIYEQEGQVSGSSTIMNYDLSQMGNHFVSPYRRGRFAQVQFGTVGSDVGQPWELHGYDWDLLPGGAR